MEWLMGALALIGGVCIFLFGMNIMGDSLERRAGGALKNLLGKLTNNKFMGFLTGMIVTCVIQSSSATTVMVVGFVNSGLMGLPQAISVIMGSNIGTTITSWILSTNAIGGSGFMKLLKPDAWTPILAVVGIIFTMFLKGDKKKDTGMIFLGFAVLMAGMTIMSDAVGGLAEKDSFRNVFTKFQNPLLCVMVGAALTGVIQSSSASVGILQSLAGQGLVNYNMAIPIIMGQNIGTCITAMLSSIGTNKNARRTAVVHLSFNVIGTIICLIGFCVAKYGFNPSILADSPNEVGIATCHTAFNLISTLILFPCSGLLAKLACAIIPDKGEEQKTVLLDERLLQTPAVALERCRVLAVELAKTSTKILKDSLIVLKNYDEELVEQIKAEETTTDKYEDILGTYLVKLSSMQIGEDESMEVTKLLKAIGDFERIGDHAINIVESKQELMDKGIDFTTQGKAELEVLTSAINEILDLTVVAFSENDVAVCKQIEPLEEVIDNLKETLRSRHVIRMQKQECSIEAGFIWVDLLTNLERTSDHCNNVAVSIMDSQKHIINLHETSHSEKLEEEFKQRYAEYCEQYKIIGDVE